MPGGGYGVSVQGIEELKAALKGSAGGLRDLRAAFEYMAETMGHNVRSHVPIGHTSPKDGGAHKSLPRLVNTVRTGASVNGPWVQMEREDLYLHEFGGASRWYRGSSGYLAPVTIGISKRGHDITRMKRIGNGHTVYTKPRTREGNFLWNVGFRERTELGEQLHFGLSTVCQKHNLPYEMPADPTLPLRPNNQSPTNVTEIHSWGW